MLHFQKLSRYSQGVVVLVGVVVVTIDVVMAVVVVTVDVEVVVDVMVAVVAVAIDVVVTFVMVAVDILVAVDVRKIIRYIFSIIIWYLFSTAFFHTLQISSAFKNLVLIYLALILLTPGKQD